MNLTKQELLAIMPNAKLRADKYLSYLNAAWIWQQGLGVNLNHVADGDDGRNSYEICKQITKRINGGYNGLESRWKYTQRALAVLRPK